MQMRMMYIGMCDVCTVVESRILGRGKVYSYKHRRGCFPSHDSMVVGCVFSGLGVRHYTLKLH